VIYILWSLPILAVTVLVASRRTSSASAGTCGLIIAIVVGLLSAPSAFGPLRAILAVAQGAWLGLLVGSVILSGLIFRDLASQGADGSERAPIPTSLRRDELYAACFLLGPFAEAATGFGVGQVAIAPFLKRAGIAPIDAVLLGLFSQILVPWGALANGTIVGAQLSGLSPAVLGAHSAILSAPLLLGWLCLFWLFAARAGVSATWRRLLIELLTTISTIALLIMANIQLGPEPAGMAALAPLIVVRFLFKKGLDRKAWRSAINAGLPYAALVGGIAATRAIPPVNQAFSQVVIRPFVEGPTWFPLTHPASWLLAIGLATALTRGCTMAIAPTLSRAWRLGKSPVLAIVLFLTMAQVMLASGMADGLAQAVQFALGSAAALATPIFAALFGFLTSSSSTANGLLMPSQSALSKGGHLSLPWLAALQNVAAAAATMLCPVRVAMGCSLAGVANLQAHVVARAWPLGALPISILLAAAAALIAISRI
jgi:lactate permease